MYWMDHAFGYRLRFSDGNGWQITAIERLRSWLDRFACIMELKTSAPNGYPHLIFVGKSLGKEMHGEMPRLALPRYGWNLRDFRALRVWLHADVPHVICELGPEKGRDLEILRMLLSCYPVYHRAQGSGGLPFHAALIERNGIGVLVAAQGSRGKTTCCKRIPAPWHALCDDETLVVPNDASRYHAHPFPTWSDYLFRRSQRTWNVERHVPLSAIFFLEQAGSDKVVPLGQGQATVRVFQSAMQVWDGKWHPLDGREKGALRRRCFENACEFAKVIPAFLLHVSLGGRFWEEMEKVLH